MSVVFWGLCWVVLGLLALVVTALATPVKLNFTLRSTPRKRFNVDARLFGGLTPPIRLNDRERPKMDTRKGRTALRFEASTGRRMVSAAPDLIAGLLRPIHWERLVVDADVGLRDPADTGQLYGMLTPLIYAVPHSSLVSILVRPDFKTAGLSGSVEASLRFIPFALVPAVVRFAWRIFGPRL